MIQTTYFDEPPRVEGETSGRRGRKKRATAHRIFISAIELMQTAGYDGVSIEQICERADVARATFFQHFANKAALMSVFSGIVCQRLEAELEDAQLAPTDQLRLIADHLQRLTSQIGAIAPSMLSAFTAEPGVSFRNYDPETGVTKLVVSIVRAGQSDGSFSDLWTAEDVAITIVSSWIGVGQHRVFNPNAPNNTPLHGILELILTGLKPQ